jgi:hypothetical protein
MLYLKYASWLYHHSTQQQHEKLSHRTRAQTSEKRFRSLPAPDTATPHVLSPAGIAPDNLPTLNQFETRTTF